MNATIVSATSTGLVLNVAMTVDVCVVVSRREAKEAALQLLKSTRPQIR